MIRTLLAFLWRRSSVNAARLVIHFAGYMTPSMLREIADYMNGLAADFEHRASQGEESAR
jgi:hypothetical protein